MANEDPTEKDIREYFLGHGWKVKKLDTGNERAADFRVCDDDICFLCEVKTIKSGRANYPAGRPIEHYYAERKRRREEIEKWQEENPDKRLVLRKDEMDFIFGDEQEFAKKYDRQRNTEIGFNEFAKELKEYFTNSRVSSLPYEIRLDSKDLYQPNLQEREKFFEWLEEAIQNIHKGKPGRQWTKTPEGTLLYFTSYPIHIPQNKNDTKSEYNLMVHRLFKTDSLRIVIPSSGTLNLDAITRNVGNGLRQLESSAAREEDQQIPRIICLAFETGINMFWNQLLPHISWLLKEYPNLSAIAILQWTPDGYPHPKGNISNWLQWLVETPKVLSFIVAHNSWLQTSKPLPTRVFKDKWSKQFSSIKD